MSVLIFDIIKFVKKSLLATTFYTLVGAFIVIISMFFVPVVRELFTGPFLFLSPLILFSILGGVLLFLTIKSKLKGKQRKLLILTGASAAGFFISILLHNLLYALGIVFGHIVILKYLFEFLHATFFIVAVVICPLGFVFGAIGTIAVLIKKSV